MSPSDSKPSLPDWQELLVEAIQLRDADRAVMLAQRCVHRYGMPTLEALLERVRGVGGQAPDGEARAWLLPLLSRSSLPLDPSPIPEVPLAVYPQEQGPSPLSAKLDEAFAPLEIAFPPLPMGALEGSLAVEPQAQPLSVPPPSHVLFSGGLSGEANNLTGPCQETSEAPPEQAGDPEQPGDAPTVLEEKEHQEGFPLLEQEIAEEEAAPVPTFELKDPPPRQRSSRKVRHGERRGTMPPPPISPALEPWLAWLPGPFRPGARP